MRVLAAMAVPEGLVLVVQGGLSDGAGSVHGVCGGVERRDKAGSQRGVCPRGGWYLRLHERGAGIEHGADGVDGPRSRHWRCGVWLRRGEGTGLLRGSKSCGCWACPCSEHASVVHMACCDPLRRALVPEPTARHM